MVLLNISGKNEKRKILSCEQKHSRRKFFFLNKVKDIAMAPKIFKHLFNQLFVRI
jgi:hypothetical protein